MLPHLSKGKRGFKARIDLVKVVQLILKRMKTGCQWRELSICEYFDKGATSWQNIHRYFLKWSKDGSFKRAWINLLSCNKKLLDLSSAQLDGSHTPVKRGGQAVSYQGRKASKTCNSLFLCDNRGQMLTVSTAQSGEHNDLYDIVKLFKEMIGVLEQSDINCNGIFVNADPGFDSEDLKQVCIDYEIELNVKPNLRNQKKQSDEYRYFDDQLYKRRTKIEHANAWMDAFKALLVRYEKIVETWMALQWLALITLFCRKLKV
ncbi:transposase [Chitinophaga sp. LS1]|uniref:transposase n=1 Tax=Chitinophaga sp. LS1 TaxID=3051176 RepID=UPI002AAC2911|nr:transposase [Chitinophaga sp. LS1]WPV70679.1 transposase [Chitinophaga sp. LS1]